MFKALVIVMGSIFTVSAFAEEKFDITPLSVEIMSKVSDGDQYKISVEYSYASETGIPWRILASGKMPEFVPNGKNIHLLDQAGKVSFIITDNDYVIETPGNKNERSDALVLYLQTTNGMDRKADIENDIVEKCFGHSTAKICNFNFKVGNIKYNFEIHKKQLLVDLNN